MDCYIAFTRTRLKFGFFGKAIAFFQGGISHSAIVFHLANRTQWYVVDSTTKGVRIHTLEKFIKYHYIVTSYEVLATDEQKQGILELAIKKSYQTYPILEVIGNGLQIVLSLVSFNKINIKNILSQGRNYPRCNELIAIILCEVFSYKIDADFDDIDLVWLERYLKGIKNV